MNRDGSWVDPASLWALWGAGGAGPADALAGLLRTAGRRLAGKRLTVPGTQGELSLCLASVHVRPDPVGLALGHLDDVRVVATDVRWRGWEAHRVVLVGHNVHVRPPRAWPDIEPSAPDQSASDRAGGTVTGPPSVGALPAPTVVAAPVTLEVRLRAGHVRDRLASIRPDLSLEIVDGGRARVRLTRRPGLGWVALTPEVTRDALLLRPRAVWLGRAGVALPSWVPMVRIALPEPAHGLRLREVTTGDGDVVLHLAVDEWRGAPSLPAWLT